MPTTDKSALPALLSFPLGTTTTKKQEQLCCGCTQCLCDVHNVTFPNKNTSYSSAVSHPPFQYLRCIELPRRHMGHFEKQVKTNMVLPLRHGFMTLKPCYQSLIQIFIHLFSLHLLLMLSQPTQVFRSCQGTTCRLRIRLEQTGKI